MLVVVAPIASGQLESDENCQAEGYSSVLILTVIRLGGSVVATGL